MKFQAMVPWKHISAQKLPTCGSAPRIRDPVWVYSILTHTSKTTQAVLLGINTPFSQYGAFFLPSGRNMIRHSGTSFRGQNLTPCPLTYICDFQQFSQCLYYIHWPPHIGYNWTSSVTCCHWPRFYPVLCWKLTWLRNCCFCFFPP